MLRAAALLLVLGASAGVGASAPVRVGGFTLDEQLRDATREAAQAEERQKRLEAAAGEAEDEVVRLRTQQLAAAQGIAAAEARISAADARARVLQAQLAAQRQRLGVEQAPASSLLAGLAMMSRRPPLALVGGGSTDDLVRLKILLAETVPVIEARTTALSRQLRRTERLAAETRSAASAMQQARQELAGRRQEFAVLEGRAVRLAEDRGAAALGAGDAALATGEELSQLQQATRTGSTAAAAAWDLAALGPAPLPAAPRAEPPPLAYRLPADARVVDGLGSVSANGIRSRGLTLATRRGEKLVAPASGTVRFAGPFRDYDGVVILDHGRGWTSVIVNAGSTARRGARLAAGQMLGTALGQVEVQLQRLGEPVSPALIAGSSQMLSNSDKGY